MDVYKEWLGIPPGPRPPDHYELLRCVRFEDDAEKVRAHYRKLNAHVRKYATGQYSTQSQELLNELAKAMLCLTDPERKRAYDEHLGREFEPQRDEFGRQPLLEVLVKQSRLSREQKKEVEEYCRRTGLSERDAVVQMKLVSPEQAAQALAIQLGLSYVEIDDMLPEESILGLVPRALVKKNSFLPLFVDDGRLMIVCADQPEHALEEELQLRYGAPCRAVIATPRAISQAITKYASLIGVDEGKAGAPATGKGGGVKGGAPPKKVTRSQAGGPRQAFSQLSPEEQQQRKQIGYIIICWTVIFFMLPQIVWGIGLTTAPLFGMGIFTCVGLATVAAGIAYWWVTQRYWK
jgi:hypothetical protein